MIPRDGSLALLTDLYQLTMAYAHFKAGHHPDAVFHLTFRSLPFHGGYAIAAGLADAISYLGTGAVQVFIDVLPEVVSPFDALWLLLALGIAWRIPKPTVVKVGAS